MDEDEDVNLGLPNKSTTGYSHLADKFRGFRRGENGFGR